MLDSLFLSSVSYAASVELISHCVLKKKYVVYYAAALRFQRLSLNPSILFILSIDRADA